MGWVHAARAPSDIARLLAKPLRSYPNCLRQFGARSRGPLSAGASAGETSRALRTAGVAASVTARWGVGLRSAGGRGLRRLAELRSRLAIADTFGFGETQCSHSDPSP